MRSVAEHVRNAGAAALLMTACASLRAGGQEVVTALDRTLQKTHMRQEATRVTLSTTPANLVVAAGDVITVQSLHVGSTGLADPGGTVLIALSRS